MAGEYSDAESDGSELALAILASLLNLLPGCRLFFRRYLSRLPGHCFSDNATTVVKSTRAWNGLGVLLIFGETLAKAARGARIAFPDT